MIIAMILSEYADNIFIAVGIIGIIWGLVFYFRKGRLFLSRFWTFVVLFFGVVYFFACINCIAFKFNTTSFLISDQLNKRLERYDVLSYSFDIASYHRDVKDAMPVKISDYDDMIDPTLDSLDALNRITESKKEYQKYLEMVLDSVGRKLGQERTTEIDSIRRSYLSVYQHGIDSIEQYMIGKDSTELILDGTYIELANKKLEYAIKWNEIESRIMDNYDLMGGSALRDTFSRLQNELIGLIVEIPKYEIARREIGGRIRSLSGQYHSNRREAVHFLDFLYYSICVGTTVSFGDIAPNCGWTRLFAVVELLICVGLLAYILEFIKPRKK